MMQVRWQLRQYLKAHGLTAYKLAQVLPDVREPTVYRLASDNAPQSVNFTLLGRILDGLSTLTGQRVQLDEVLEVSEIPVMPAETFNPAEIKPFARRATLNALPGRIDTTALSAEIRGK